MTTKSWKQTYRIKQDNTYDSDWLHQSGAVNRSLNYNASANGGDLPSYRSRIRAHGDATNTFSGSKIIFEPSTGHATSTFAYWETSPPPGHWSEQKYSTVGDLTTWPTYPGVASVSPRAANLAKAQFINQARQKMSPIQGGVVLGELRETIEMLRHPARSLRRGVDAYLSRLRKAKPGFKRASPQRRTSFVRDTWLEYSFGWRPFLSDIKSAAQALAAYQTEHLSDTERISGFGEDKVQVSASFGSGNYGTTNWGWSVDIWEHTKCYIKGSVLVSQNGQRPALTVAGVLPQDFLPTIWELIPYSFLVDYFTNIGDIVSAASFNNSNIVYASMTTVADRVERHGPVSDLSKLPNNVYYRSSSVYQGEGTLKTRSIVRAPISSFVPSLVLKTPFRDTQWLNVAALSKNLKGLVPF